MKHNYIHPLWSAKNKDHPFDYDYQLLELDEPLKYDENIQPIKIGRIEDMVVGKLVAVTGWGNTEENVSLNNSCHNEKLELTGNRMNWEQ